MNPAWGSVTAKSGKLKKSCRNYHYDYVVTAPELGTWDLNVDVVDPKGKVVWFGYEYEGQSPAAGRATFRLCSSQATR